MVFPWIPYFEKLARGGVLSDTEFMAIKTFEGKMLFNHTIPSAQTDLSATSVNAITPANGKTFYHYISRTAVASTVISPNIDAVCIIRNNGTTQDHIGYGSVNDGPAYSDESRIASELIGNGSLEFDQLVSWDGNNANTTWSFTLQGWIEDTGISPQVPSI